jgi:hypothetical protein
VVQAILVAMLQLCLYQSRKMNRRIHKQQGIHHYAFYFVTAASLIRICSFYPSANRDKHLQDDNDEIVLIPDLDEEGGADSDQRSKQLIVTIGCHIVYANIVNLHCSCTCPAKCE